MRVKEDTLSSVYSDLTLTEHEKKILFAEDDELEEPTTKIKTGVKKIGIYEIEDPTAPLKENIEEESRFDRFK